MFHGDALGLFVGAVALGAVHGIEPGHGWPVAASYALDQTNTWLYGLAASLLIGVGHLVSSIAMVAVFFYAKAYFDLTQVNEPISLDAFGTTVVLGGPVSLVAGVLLVALGVREYTHGHSHSHGGGADHADHDHDHTHDHDHADHDHGDEERQGDGHAHEDGHDQRGQSRDHHHDSQGQGQSHGHAGSGGGVLARVASAVPFLGGESGSHSHGHGDLESGAERGLFGIAWFAFVLGFAHEEEFEIIALCAGSTHCLELMTAYALTVVVGIVGLTMLLIAGYEHFEERVERYTPYLPVFSAAVLVLMGVGFIAGVF